MQAKLLMSDRLPDCIRIAAKRRKIRDRSKISGIPDFFYILRICGNPSALTPPIATFLGMTKKY